MWLHENRLAKMKLWVAYIRHSDVLVNVNQENRKLPNNKWIMITKILCIIMTNNIGNDTSASTTFSMDRTNKPKSIFINFYIHILLYCKCTWQFSFIKFQIVPKQFQSSHKLKYWEIENKNMTLLPLNIFQFNWKCVFKWKFLF